jgi:hypothetical protein
MDGYLADVRFVDGQALAASSFGEDDPASGSWRPKAYAGIYGNNGFRLDFADASSLTSGSNAGLGKDSSGRGNYWNTSNVALTDSVLDSPTNNFATLNAALPITNQSLSAGNLVAAGSIAYRSRAATVSLPSGKWYWEVRWDTWVNDSHLGIMNSLNQSVLDTWFASTANGFGWAGSGGDLWTGNSYFDSAFDSTFTTGDTCQIAFDASSGKMWFGKNGTWLKSSNPATDANPHWTGLSNGPYYPAVMTTNGTVATVNFGQGGQSGLTYYSDAGGSFKHAPPTGFKALSTKNMAAPAISKPSQYFDVLTYAGDSNARSITGLSFQPDFVWTKDRSVASSHRLQDSVR